MRRGHRLHSVHGAEPDMAGLARLPSVHRCLMVMVVVLVHRSTSSRTSSIVMCSLRSNFIFLHAEMSTRCSQGLMMVASFINVIHVD